MAAILLSAGTTLVSTEGSALVASLACTEVWLTGHLSNTRTLLVGGASAAALPLWSGTHLGPARG